jgi:DNA primase
VVTLPPGEDPDTLVRHEGAAGLRHYLDQAVDVLDRKLRILEEKDRFRDIERTRGALDRLLPTLRATVDPALRDIYVTKVAERTGVRRETLEAELSRSVRRRPSGGPAAVRTAAPHPRGGAFALGPERMVLRVLVNRPEWVEEAAESVGEGDFHDPLNRRVFQRILSGDLDAAVSDPDPRLAARIEALRGDPEDLTHARELLQSAVASLQNRSEEDRVERLRTELAGTMEEDRRTELVREIDRLKKARMVKGANQGAAAWAVLRHLEKGNQERNADD